MFYDILEQKISFLGYKHKKFKKSKNIYRKGLTNSFGTKLAVFPNFFFRKYRPGKCLLKYFLEGKNAFLGYKNKKSKKSEKSEVLPKWLTHGFGPKKAIFPTSFV